MVRGAPKLLEILLTGSLPVVLFTSPVFYQAAEPGREHCLRASSSGGRPGKPPFFTGRLSSPSEQVSRQLPFMRADFRKALKPRLV